MELPEVIQVGVASAATAVLVAAAVSDIRRRRIPNWTVITLIGLFAVLVIAVHGAGLLSALAAAGVALAVSVALYAFRLIGAGDSKLITAVALFAGLGYLPLLILATALTGGVIAMLSLAARPTRALTMVTMRGRGDWGRGVPYGVAIAVGGALVIWAPMTDVVRPVGERVHVSGGEMQKLIGAQPTR